MLTPLEQALLAGGLGLLMLGVGTTLRLADFRRVLRAPKAALTGLASQIGLMPVLAYALSRALDLPAEVALALVLVGCTPGGTTSNMYSHFARGDVALSIGMTALSTTAALVTLPTLAWLYGQTLGLAHLQVPAGKIAGATAFVLVPVGLGMLIRTRRPRFARPIERAGNIAGVTAGLCMLITWAPRMWQQVGELPPTVHGAIGLLLAAGMGAGYLASSALGLPRPQRRTVLLETGLQNTALTFAVIQLSFPPAQAEAMAWVPLLYGFAAVSVANVLTLWFRFGPSPTGDSRTRASAVPHELHAPPAQFAE